MQRQYNVGLNSVPKTISSVVDRNRLGPRLGPIPRTGPERAWPGGTEIAKNRKNEESLKGGPPKYLPAYTTDVSHLVV